MFIQMTKTKPNILRYLRPVALSLSQAELGFGRPIISNYLNHNTVFDLWFSKSSLLYPAIVNGKNTWKDQICNSML